MEGFQTRMTRGFGYRLFASMDVVILLGWEMEKGGVLDEMGELHPSRDTCMLIPGMSCP